MRVRGRFVAAVVAIACGLMLGVLPAYAGDGTEPPTPADSAPSPIEAAAAPAADAMEPGLHERTTHLIVYTYNDLLGRDPEPDGLIGWQGALLAGAPRSQVAYGITYSYEYRARLVTDAYQRYLGRGPDPAGLNGWVAAMDRGWTVARIGAGFIASDEYYQRSGGTRSGWVTALYRDVLRREPSADEVSAWGLALARGETREQVALGFLLSTEHLATVVDGYYMTLLRRHLDPVGLRGWVALLQAGHHDEEIVGGLVASDEYWNLTATFPLDRLVLTPDYGWVEAGTAVTFAAQGMGRWDDLGDVTSRASFSLDGVPCAGATCSTTTAGTHVVTASLGDVWTAVDLVVRPGPLDHVALTPEARTVADGASVLYAAQGFDVYDNPYGDVTSQLTFAVDGDAAACTGARCRPAAPGDHVVTAVGLEGQATVSVSPPGPQGAALWGWGYAGSGMLGAPTSPTTRLVPAPVGADTTWSQLAATANLVVATRTDGSVWSWGGSTLCGNGTSLGARPEQVGVETDWADVAAVGSTIVGLKQDGTLWAWGDLSFGVGASATVCQPTQIAADRRWQSVSAEYASWAAIAEDGSLWMWGRNTNGQLGDGTQTDRAVPTFVDAGPWVQVASSANHSVGLKADGTVWAWGDNRNGRLGDGTRVSSLVPVRVGSRSDWAGVAVTTMASAAVDEAGVLWWWGGASSTNEATLTDVLSPETLDSSRPWSAVASGTRSRFVLASDGTLWAWGPNNVGQLGDGTTTSAVLAPVQAGTGAGWLSVVSTPNTTLALRDPAAVP